MTTDQAIAELKGRYVCACREHKSHLAHIIIKAIHRLAPKFCEFD